MLTREQALAIYYAGPEAVIEALCDLSRQVDLRQQQVVILREKVQMLEKAITRLSKNSSNSSKPPSSDDITKPRPKKPKDAKRSNGAQPGHPKHQRTPFPQEDIDKFHEYHLNSCPECGNSDVEFLDLPPRVTQQMELKESK